MSGIYWNQTSNIARHIFKSRLKELLCTKVQPLFSYCARPVGVHLSRFRMGLSGLNWHRFKYNFIENPSCNSCVSVKEDITHFLLCCPKYAAPRNAMLAQVTPIITKLEIDLNKLTYCKKTQKEITILLIRGSTDLSLIENQQIFNHVCNFIKTTKRFV